MLLLVLFLAANLAHNSPLNAPPTGASLSMAVHGHGHGHVHDSGAAERADGTDGDMHVHTHPVADRVVSAGVQVRVAGIAPLYRRTTSIALRWPSTIPLKPPSPAAAA